jgi:hypothetical protein
MTIKTYNNETILAPLKCGTRFMDEIFKAKDTGYNINELKRTLFLPKIQAIIIRPPMEHIVSALHTEIINAHNNTEINPDEPVDILAILDSFLWKGPHQTIQNTHWHRDLYETLYWSWRRNRNNIKIVDLKDLSTYLKSIGIKPPKHKKEAYNFSNFKNYCDVDEMMMFISNAYPDEWKNILSQIEHANVFYNYLMDGEVIPIKFV